MLGSDPTFSPDDTLTKKGAACCTQNWQDFHGSHGDEIHLVRQALGLETDEKKVVRRCGSQLGAGVGVVGVESRGSLVWKGKTGQYNDQP